MLATQPPQRVAQVFLVVVHALVRAMLARKRDLLVGRSAGDDASAHLPAELHGRQSDTAGRTEHRECLARLERGAMLERVVAGSVRDRQRGSAVEIEVGGEL